MANEELQIFNNNTIEYCKLEKACLLLNHLVYGTPYRFNIDTIYFDYGQDWLYTTIICEDTRKPETSVLRSYQFFSPQDQATVLYRDITTVNLLLIAKVKKLLEQL